MTTRFRVTFLLLVVGLAVAPVSAQADNAMCLACHSAPGFSKAGSSGGTVSLQVSQDELSASAHARLGCLNCHTDLRGQQIPHRPDVAPVDCARCHGASGTESTARVRPDVIHAKAAGSGNQNAPSCKTCHGTHSIRPAADFQSDVHRARVSDTCRECHSDRRFTRGHGLSNAHRRRRALGAAVTSGKGDAAAVVVCTDCHIIHDESAKSAFDSSLARRRVAGTCGRCHRKELEDYAASVHGRAVAQGVMESAVCTDCHGEHNKASAASAGSRRRPRRIVATCSKCHEDVKLLRKYSLSKKRLSSYAASFHGVASKFGDLTVADCASCHQYHKILASSDPESAVNKKNLPKTCGKCHPGACDNFAKGSVHVVPTAKSDSVVFWVRLLYTIFVVVVIGAFVGYIILDLIARAMGRLPRRKENHGR